MNIRRKPGAMNTVYVALLFGLFTRNAAADTSAVESIATSTTAGSFSEENEESQARFEPAEETDVALPPSLMETNYAAYVSGGLGGLTAASGLALLLRGLTGTQGMDGADPLDGAGTRKWVGTGLLAGATIMLTYSAILYFSDESAP